MHQGGVVAISDQGPVGEGFLKVRVGIRNEEVKEKPRMYTYVADWVIPRAQWPDWDKVQLPLLEHRFQRADAEPGSRPTMPPIVP